MSNRWGRIALAALATVLAAVQAAPGDVTARSVACIAVTALCGFLSPGVFNVAPGTRLDLAIRLLLGAVAAGASAVQMLDGDITAKRVAAAIGSAVVAFLSPRLIGLVKVPPPEPPAPQPGGAMKTRRLASELALIIVLAGAGLWLAVTAAAAATFATGLADFGALSTYFTPSPNNVRFAATSTVAGQSGSAVLRFNTLGNRLQINNNNAIGFEDVTYGMQRISLAEYFGALTSSACPGGGICAGPYTIGLRIGMYKAKVARGMRYACSSGKTMKISLWDDTSTRLASQTSCACGGANVVKECDFGTPYTTTAWTTYRMSGYEESGAQAYVVDKRANYDLPTANNVMHTLEGDGWWVKNEGYYYASNDAWPGTGSGSSAIWSPLELITVGP